MEFQRISISDTEYFSAFIEFQIEFSSQKNFNFVHLKLFFLSLSLSVRRNLMWDVVNKMATLQNSLFPFLAAGLFQAPLVAELSNNLMGTRSKCLWVKCRGPWTRMSCEECLRSSDLSTKSMSSVIKLLVKVKVRSKKQRLISVCDGVKGQLILKCSFLVQIFPKNQRYLFPDFCPSL